MVSFHLHQKVPHNLNFGDLIKLLEKAEKDLNKFSEDRINSCSKKRGCLQDGAN